MIQSRKKISVLFLLSTCVIFVASAPMVFAALTFNGTNISGDTNSIIDATGTISIGASSATGITIGKAGVTATFPGTVTITGTTTTLQNLVISGTCTGSGCLTPGGDLSGTSASQTVTGIRGRAVSSTAPSVNQVLMWNGSFWTPANVTSTSGITAINGLSNATTSIVGAGNVTVSTSSPNTITITGTGAGAITINGLATSTFQILGTANQIAVATSGPNNVTLSLPQNIGTTNTPTFGGIMLNGNATTTGLTISGLGSTGSPCLIVSATGAVSTSTCAAAGFTAGGDLSGNATSQTVTGLQGRTLASTAPSTNQVLMWNGTNWAPANVTASTTATTSINGLTTPTFQFNGTANQITVATSSTSTITWSLPQNLAAASTPTFAGLTVNGNATTTGNLAILGFLSDAGGNKYVTSTTGGVLTSGNNTWTGAQTFNATTTFLGPIVESSTGAGSVQLTEGACPAGSSGNDLFCADSTTHALQSSLNGGSYFAIPQLAGDLGNTASSPMVIGVQTNQTPSAAGQVAVKTSSSTFNFNDGTAERVLDPVQCTSPFIIQNVTSSPVSDEVIWSPYVTSTIVLFRSVNLKTGDTVTFNVLWGSQRSTASASAQHLFASNQTSNSITTWDSFAPGTFASTTVPSGSFVRALTTSAASSSEWTSQICYRENP